MTDLVTTTPLDALDPRERLAVEFYTNPLMGRTFGNKRQSVLAAGFNKNHSHLFDKPHIQAAVQWLYERRDEQAGGVAAYLATYTMEAAHKLISQLGADHGIEPMPMPEGLLDREPAPIIRNSKVIGYNDGHLKQAAAITQHNKAAAALMKEAREAAKLILAYHMGTPEMKVKMDRGGDRQDPLDLGSLDDKQLRELARHVQEVRDLKAGLVELPPEEEE